MTQGTKILMYVWLSIILVILVLGSVYLGVWSSTLRNIDTSTMTLIVAFTALLVASAEYYRKKSIDRQESRPYVLASLLPKQTRRNIVELVVQNTGKTLARDLSIRFTPDHKPIRGTSRSMNQLGVLKNMGILTPGEVRRYFFGIYSETPQVSSIKKEFRITVSYTDVTSKRRYEDVFICNPTDYEGMIQNNDNGLHEIQKTLGLLVESQEKIANLSKKLTETVIEDGVRLRNLHVPNMHEEELLNLTVNTFTNGSKDEGRLKPYMYDYKLLVKQARDLLLKQKVIDTGTEKLVDELNSILSSDWNHEGERVEDHFRQLQGIRKAKEVNRNV